MAHRYQLFLFIVTVTLLGSFPAQAAMQYFHFAGTVSAAFEEHGLTDGQELSYVIGVDFDREGYRVTPDGIVHPEPDRSFSNDFYDYSRDTFFTKGFIDLALNLAPIGPGLEGSDEHYGQATEYVFGPDDYLRFGNMSFSILGDDYFNGSPDLCMVDTIADDTDTVGAFPMNWEVGDLFTTKFLIGNSASNAAVTLISISDTNPMAPTPIPSAALLLGTGILGLATMKRKRS